MKSEIRLLGIDDGPFLFRYDHTIVIGVIMRGGGYIEGVIQRVLPIDGLNATEICIDMIKKTRHRKQLKAVLIDGVTLGGFNIVDIETIFSVTKVPVITITRDQPDMKMIKNALRAHFTDWKDRYDLINQGETYCLKTSYNPIFIKIAGMNIERAKEIITLSTIRGVIPEPIRVAHIIASGVMRGESYGKA